MLRVMVEWTRFRCSLGRGELTRPVVRLEGPPVSLRTSGANRRLGAGGYGTQAIASISTFTPLRGGAASTVVRAG